LLEINDNCCSKAQLSASKAQLSASKAQLPASKAQLSASELKKLKALKLEVWGYTDKACN